MATSYGIKNSDANFNDTVFILTDTGINAKQNTTFVDESTSSLTVTVNGTITQGSNNPYVTTGYASTYFDGNGDYLEHTANANYACTGDLTFECWAYPISTATSQAILDQWYSSAATNWQMFINSSTYQLQWYYDGNSVISATTGTTLTPLSWNHVALTRSGSRLTIWLNGTQVSTGTFAGTIGQNAILRIGKQSGGSASYFFNGFISNARIINGTAVYTANFTPATVPLSAITNTQILGCQNLTFKDNSTNNIAVTQFGNAAVTRFNPFNDSTIYTTVNLGGSAYFDGASHLAISTSTVFQCTGDLTFEAWVFPTQIATNQALLDQYYAGTAGQGNWQFFLTGAQPQWYYDGSSSINGSTNVNVGCWNHIAGTRSGSTLRLFLNGVQVATGTFAGTIGANNILRLGKQSSGISYFFNGYMTGVRITNGTALYTAAFTPPTQLLTTGTNTKFLTNFNNAGVYDGVFSTHIVTSSTAQVSTATARFGTSSIKFNGTTDWLSVPDKSELQLATSNFTIEGWVNLSAGGAVRGIAGKGSATTGWLLSTNASNQITFTDATTAFTSTNAISTATWYHLAVVRSGTGANQTKIYINGSNDGIGTSASNLNQTNIMYIGADRTGTNPWNGYIGEFRITRDTARYTADFTPPLLKFPKFYIS